MTDPRNDPAEEPTNGRGTPGPDPSDAVAGAIEPATPTEIAKADPSRLPVTRLESAQPTRTAKGLAYSSILIAGLCGGLIGYAFTDLQCSNGCSNWAALGGLVGALLGAIGVAIVSVLVLRAMDEWHTTKGPIEPRDKRS